MSGHWLWLDRPYSGEEKVPVELNAPRGTLAGGVYWEVWDPRTGTWDEARYSGDVNHRFVFAGVRKAALALREYGRWSDLYRLVRLDDHVPLIVARRLSSGRWAPLTLAKASSAGLFGSAARIQARTEEFAEGR